MPGTRTLPAERFIGSSKNAILSAVRVINALDPCRALHRKFQKRNAPAFRARNARDPCRGLHRKFQKHNFISSPRDQHARSLQRAALGSSKNAILPAFHARSAHDPCRPWTRKNLKTGSEKTPKNIRTRSELLQTSVHRFCRFFVLPIVSFSGPFCPKKFTVGYSLRKKGWPRYASATSPELVCHMSALAAPPNLVLHVFAFASPSNLVHHTSALPLFVSLFPQTVYCGVLS